MKKIFKILGLITVTALLATSCLKENELVSSPECYVMSFSIGDIKTPVTVHRDNAADTTIVKTISGSSIRFKIDHIKGIITTVDSVPSWTNLSKVVPSFNSLGTMLFKLDDEGNYYALTSGKDSISFEKPVDALVIASDGLSSKQYVISINRMAADADTIVWAKDKANTNFDRDFKLLAFGNSVMSFSSDSDGYMTVTCADAMQNLTSWSQPEKINGTKLDYASVTAFGNDLYALSNEGYIYKAINPEQPYNWEKASDKAVERILAADNHFIYILCEGKIIGSGNLTDWKVCGTTDIDKLPTNCINSYSYQTRTNGNIYSVVMTGVNDCKGSVWYKITSDDEYIDQQWMHIDQDKHTNLYPMPAIKDLSTIYYANRLIALGNETDGGYKYLYFSEDNGISWHEQTSKYPIPADLKAENGMAKLISANGRIWIIQQGGNVWNGEIK